MAKQYKLKFRPTPISRLLKRPKMPFQMVGYPYASNWATYYVLNYKFMVEEKKQELQRQAALIQYGQGPFVDDYAAQI